MLIAQQGGCFSFFICCSSCLCFLALYQMNNILKKKNPQIHLPHAPTVFPLVCPHAPARRPPLLLFSSLWTLPPHSSSSLSFIYHRGVFPPMELILILPCSLLFMAPPGSPEETPSSSAQPGPPLWLCFSAFSGQQSGPSVVSLNSGALQTSTFRSYPFLS